MSGVRRVFVEKKKPFAVNAKELHDEITGYLGIKDITDVRVLIRYDIENLSDDTYKKALTTVFSEPPVDDVYENEFTASEDDYVFSVEYLPGQFDQRADSAEQCVKFLNENETPVIKTATTYIISGKLTDDDKDRLRTIVLIRLTQEWLMRISQRLLLLSSIRQRMLLYLTGSRIWRRISLRLYTTHLDLP